MSTLERLAKKVMKQVWGSDEKIVTPTETEKSMFRSLLSAEAVSNWGFSPTDVAEWIGANESRLLNPMSSLATETERFRTSKPELFKPSK